MRPQFEAFYYTKWGIRTSHVVDIEVPSQVDDLVGVLALTILIVIRLVGDDFDARVTISVLSTGLHQRKELANVVLS
jgi:hypothetical protein